LNGKHIFWDFWETLIKYYVARRNGKAMVMGKYKFWAMGKATSTEKFFFGQ